MEDLPPFDDYAMRGRTYRYLEKPPLWPFGHGLSYTTFRAENLVVPKEVPTGADVPISLELQNAGARAGDEVVQVYVSRPGAPAYAPRRWLAAFTRVASLASGERRAVSLTLPARAFTLVDDRGQRLAPAGDFVVTAGPELSARVRVAPR
jgi:beta-glucosidase